MVKKVGLALALVAVLVSVLGIGNYVFAGGGSSGNSTETAVAVIGSNVQIGVQNPFQVTAKNMGTFINWKPNTLTPVYPGMTIGNGEITIANISPINQAVILSARPITVPAGGAWPSLEVVATSGSATYSPWQQIVIAPGVSVTLGVEVKVAYGGAVSSPFNGVELVVLATPPQNRPSGCDPQGCG